VEDEVWKQIVHHILSSLILVTALLHLLGAIFNDSQPHRWLRLSICCFFLATTAVLVSFYIKGLIGGR
jgi:hypothetical protein